MNKLHHHLINVPYFTDLVFSKNRDNVLVLLTLLIITVFVVYRGYFNQITPNQARIEKEDEGKEEDDDDEEQIEGRVTRNDDVDDHKQSLLDEDRKCDESQHGNKSDDDSNDDKADADTVGDGDVKVM